MKYEQSIYCVENLKKMEVALIGIGFKILILVNWSTNKMDKMSGI